MLVVKFGVRSLVDGEAAAITEMRTAHRLYNSLVAIERWRRHEYSAIRSRFVPGLSEAETAYEQIDEWLGEHYGRGGERGEIRAKRQKARSKSVDDAAELDTIGELKVWRKECSELSKKLRAEFGALVDPAEKDYAARVEALSPKDAKNNHARKRANASVREAMLNEPEWHTAWKELARLEATAYELRAWMGDAHTLNHGTYAAVHDAVQQAGKRPRPRPDGEPRRPRERPAFAKSRLRKMGWQIQGTVTWGDILGGRCRDVRVTDVRGKRATVALRIRTGATWVSADVVLHRPIPEATRVRWVYLVPEARPCERTEYSVQFTLDCGKLIERAPGKGHVQVDLRWTKHGDTLLVALANGEPLLLPADIVSRLHHCERLQGYSDEYFDVAKVVAGVPQHARSHDRLRQQARLDGPEALATWRTWRDERLGAKLDLYAPPGEYPHGRIYWLDMWRRKDEHLERMIAGTRRRAMRHRLDFYRVFAARLSERYKTCTLGGAVDLEALALRDKTEDRPTAELHRSARRNRTIAAVSELKAAIEYAFGPERMRERSDDDKNTGGARAAEITEQSAPAMVEQYAHD
jgi:hypothetical protein